MSSCYVFSRRCILLLPALTTIRRFPNRLLGVLLSVVVLGCGSKASGFFGQSPQTYTYTITATSGSLSHSTNVTLTVE